MELGVHHRAHFGVSERKCPVAREAIVNLLQSGLAKSGTTYGLQVTAGANGRLIREGRGPPVTDHNRPTPLRPL